MPSVLLGVVGVIALWAEVNVLEAGRRRDNVHWANRAVSTKIKAARAFLASREWDKAAEALDQALTTDDATNLAEARKLLTAVQGSRADAFFQAAQTAIEHKDTAKALSLVNAFLADPGAADKERGIRLQNDIELATSAEQARELLQKLPDDSLASFATGRPMATLERVQAGPLREIYSATLRAQLPQEQQRRTDLRLAQKEAARRKQEEEQKRDARIRSTAAYRELIGFVNANKQTKEDPRLLALLMKELNVTNPADQKKALAELAGRGGQAGLASQVDRERVVLNDRFRTYAGFDQADRERFRRLVDEALDGLLRELKGPPS
jgi:hypothetical protein